MAQKRIAAVVALAAAIYGTPAHAVLLDHGPLDPVITFPTWYRDLNGVALQQCRSSTSSPNAAAGLAPMCFPLAATPGAFAGNLGGELFYHDVSTALTGPAFSLRYVTALEMAYLSATGDPARGQEVVFARIRVVMAPSVPGTYKVTHPYGVEVFPDVGTGPRAVFFTEDIVPVPGNFDAALGGRVGPFLQWDQLLPGESLTVTNAAGATEQFVGDPNYDHTFTGSPFGTNFLRVDGPPGSNLDGAGNDFMLTPLAAVLGQLYTAPIPAPLAIKRASYTRDPAAGITGVDVWAQALPTAKLILTATDLPSVQMKSDGLGNFMAHIEIPATAPLASFVRVTNMSDNPATTKTATIADNVEITKATYDTLTKTLTVNATSSDKLAPGPALSVAGLFGGVMTAGAYSAVIPSGIPPMDVTVVSSAAGSHSDDVLVLPGLTDASPFSPVAVADTFTVSENAVGTLALTANDAVVPPASVGSVLVITPPASGTVAATATPGTVTYKPNLNFFGTDTFEYVVQDSLGNVSNATTVTLSVVFTPFAPTAKGDNWAQTRNTARTVNVLANDTAALGTTLDPASIVIVSPPASGTAVPNGLGGITYTPGLNFAGSVTFTYTVKNNFGQVSAPATVFVFVSTTAETLTPRRVDYIVSKKAWTIIGNTSVFGPQLTPSVTCWVGRTAGAGAVLGTAPIDSTGSFTLVPVAGTVAGPDATNAIACQSTNGGIGVFGVTLK
jgi:hypothetical protein